MSKKGREKKRRKMQRRGLPGTAPAFVFAQGASSAHQALMQKMARSGGTYAQDDFIRILIDCRVLRQEPEFRDLYFDLDQAAEVSSRVMAKYEKQLCAMVNEPKDERQQFYDEVRIEIIDELATPAFRKGVMRRLEDLSQRLANGKDMDKYEMALFLQPALEMNEIPWGLCGLITTIYEESADRAAEQYRQGRKAVGEFIKTVEREGNLEKLLTLPDESPEVAELVKQVQAQPGLWKQLEREAYRGLHEFEQAVARGEVELDLFTPEELQRAFALMAEYISAKQIDVDAADPQTLAHKLAEFIKHSIGKVMTEERTQRMKDDLNRLSAQWLREKNWKGALLHMEISYLDSEEPSENPFLYAAYVGQVAKLRDAGSSVNSSPENSSRTETPTEPQFPKADATPNARRGWIGRVAHLFRRR